MRLPVAAGSPGASDALVAPSTDVGGLNPVSERDTSGEASNTGEPTNPGMSPGAGEPSDASEPSAPSEPSGTEAPPVEGTARVFALLNINYTTDEPVSYVVLSNTVDFSEVDLTRALEVPGYGGISVAAGHLLVSNHNTSSITRYQVADDLTLTQRETLSFASLGVVESSFLRNYMLDDQLGFMELEVNKAVLWNPSTFEIRGVMETSSMPLQRDGLLLFPNSNRGLYRPRPGTPVMRPFSYHDDAWLVWAPETQIASYDSATGQEFSYRMCLAPAWT